MERIHVVDLSSSSLTGGAPVLTNYTAFPLEDNPYPDNPSIRVESPPLEVYVGPSRVHFTVPRNPLIKHSAYWRHHLTPQILSQPAITLTLPHDHPGTFDLVLQFLQRSTYSVPPESQSQSPAIFVHTAVYLFAHKYHMPLLSTHALQQIYKLLVSYHNARYSAFAERLELPERVELVRMVYAGTEGFPKDPLRALVLKDFARRWEEWKVCGGVEGVWGIGGFVRDLMGCLGNGRDELEVPGGVRMSARGGPGDGTVRLMVWL
ncbi:hypothetical protein P167DRAFT_566979 [Morchella conica CCBAS932]|uniref:BTB domain-containing protein n=2 Tax=Morchella sect. Distantes TaxID=1051054 RepID=A0A3N4KK33_9PEZI|nr:hypothetical protein P167DRAFT_566979 [Morchella conica CCBAS932]